MGVKLLMTGVTRKDVLLDPGPPVAVTVIGPVVALLGTTALTWVADTGVMLVEAVPLNATDETPPNPEPLIVTCVATGPLVGEKELTTTAGAMVNEALVAVPPGVVTLTVPVVVPVGTVVLIWVSEITLKVAVLLLKNLTDVVPVKLVPLIVTGRPMEPLAGESEVIAGLSVNVLALVAVPPELVTVILPVVAPEGTVAVILVLELMVNAAGVPLNATPVTAL